MDDDHDDHDDHDGHGDDDDGAGGRHEGAPGAAPAMADRRVRRAVVMELTRSILGLGVAIIVFFLGVALIAGAWGDRRALEDRGTTRAGLILEVDRSVPGARWVRYSYDGDDRRVQQRQLVFGSYERGQRVAVHLDVDDPTDATLKGETPQSGWGWIVSVGALLVGVVVLPSKVRSTARSIRLARVLQTHPWSHWILQAAYPGRRRVAIVAEGQQEEHLVRVDRRGSRRLGRLARKTDLLVAGSGRWFVLCPPGRPSLLALGRMDLPYERLHLLGSEPR